MRYDPDKHRRRSIRLSGYDYSQSGTYFVTVCTYERECFLGEVLGGEMKLNEAGREARAGWERLPDHYPHVRLDAFVVMPNHVHGIIILNNETSVGPGLHPDLVPGRIHSLSEVIRAFKTFSSRRINVLRDCVGSRTWQRNYYEHIVRSDTALEAIRAYIAANPRQWVNDPERPDNVR